MLTAVVAGAVIKDVVDTDDCDRYLNGASRSSSELGEAMLKRQKCLNEKQMAADLLIGAFSDKNDNDWDWDYLAGSRQWRCRGIQTGEFADNDNCRFDAKDDDRWPN